MDLRRKVLINNISDVSRNGYETANEDSSNSLYLSCVEDLENTLSPSRSNKNTSLISSPLKERSVNIHEIITTSTPMKEKAFSNENLSFEEFLEDQVESDNNDTTVKAINEVSLVSEPPIVIPPIADLVIPEIVIEPPTSEPIKDEKFEESPLKEDITEVVVVEDKKAQKTEVIDIVTETMPVIEPFNQLEEISTESDPVQISEKERHITIRKTFIPQKMVNDSVDFPLTNAINPFTSRGFKKSTTKRSTIVPPTHMPLRSMMPKVKEVVNTLTEISKMPTRKSVFTVRFQSKTSLLSPAGLNDSFRRRGNLRRTLVPGPAVDNTQKTVRRNTLFQTDKRKTLNQVAKKVDEKKSTVKLAESRKPIIKLVETKKSEKRRSSSPISAVEILKKTKPDPFKARVAPQVTTKFATSRNQCKYCDKGFSLQQALDNHYFSYCSKIPAGARKKIIVENYNKERDTFTGLSEKRRTIFALPTASVSVNASTRNTKVSSTPKAHSGVYRTPKKTLKCTTCNKVFLDVLDFANHMQKHKLEHDLKDAADKAKIDV